LNRRGGSLKPMFIMNMGFFFIEIVCELYHCFDLINIISVILTTMIEFASSWGRFTYQKNIKSVFPSSIGLRLVLHSEPLQLQPCPRNLLIGGGLRLKELRPDAALIC